MTTVPDAEGLPAAEQSAEPLEKATDGSPDLAPFWNKRISEATRQLDKDKRIENWRRWTEKAAGRWDRDKIKGDFVAVNKPHSVITAQVAQTYANNPKFKVMPRQPGQDDAADQQTALVNWIVDEIGLKREGKLATKQAYTLGHSWVKVWWQSKMTPVTLSQPQVSLDPLTQRTTTNYTVQIDMGKPRVRWVSSFDVRVDPDAKRIEDARWIAHRVVRPTEAVKADSRYKNTDGLQGMASAADDSRIMYSDRTDLQKQAVTETKRTILWEVEDFEHKTWLTIAEGHDATLREETDEYQAILGDQGMWVHFEADEDLLSVYGIGIMHLIETLADEKNTLRRRQLNHTKRANPKILTPEAASDSFLDDVSRGDDLTISKASPDVIDKTKVLEMPNLPMDNSRAEAQVDRDIAEAAGSSDLQMGAAIAGANTATEVAAIGSNERIRVSARVDLIETSMRTIGRKILKLCRTYMKTPQVVRILGEGGITGWRQFTPAEIDGEFDVSVEFGSTVLRDQMERRQVDQNLYNLVKDDPFVQRIEILKDIFRDFDKKDVARYLNQSVINLQAYQQAIMHAVQTGNAQLAMATVQAMAQNVNPPAAGPAIPMQGMPSARPMAPGAALAAGPPKGGEGPNGAIPTPGAIRSEFFGRANAPRQ